MNSKMIDKLVSTIMLAVLLMGVATVARAAVVYSEDFNSYTAGDPLSVAGWTGPSSATIKLSAAPFDALNESGFDANGNYVDGRTGGFGDKAFYDVGYHNTGIWTLTANLKFTGQGYSAFGLRDSTPDAHTSPTGLGPLATIFQNHPYDGGAGGLTTTGLYSDWGYANSGYGVALPEFWDDPGTSGWHVELIMDYDANQFKGTATYLATDVNHAAGYTQTTGWLPFSSYLGNQDSLYGFDQLYIFNATSGNTVQVDNIVLSSNIVPEPALMSMLLVGLCVVVGKGRLRSRRAV